MLTLSLNKLMKYVVFHLSARSRKLAPSSACSNYIFTLKIHLDVMFYCKAKNTIICALAMVLNKKTDPGMTNLTPHFNTTWCAYA